MSIILVRHGETLLNASRTMQPTDTPLSPLGVQQAHAVAKRLATLGLKGILSSDLPRALVTAQAIAAATGAPLETTPLLHERNFGDLRGKPYDDLGFNPFQMEEAPPNGESARQFRDRVALAFAHAARSRAALEGNLAVVTHGLVIRAIVGAHVSLREGQAALLKVGNTSVTIIDANEPYAVELLDCTRHLETADGPGQDARALSGG